MVSATIILYHDTFDYRNDNLDFVAIWFERLVFVPIEVLLFICYYFDGI